MAGQGRRWHGPCARGLAGYIQGYKPGAWPYAVYSYGTVRKKKTRAMAGGDGDIVMALVGPLGVLESFSKNTGSLGADRWVFFVVRRFEIQASAIRLDYFPLNNELKVGRFWRKPLLLQLAPQTLLVTERVLCG